MSKKKNGLKPTQIEPNKKTKLQPSSRINPLSSSSTMPKLRTMLIGKKSSKGSYLMLVDASGSVLRLEGDPLVEMRKRIADCNG